MKKQIILASNNKDKLKEFQALLTPIGLNVCPQSKYNISEISELHSTFLENALAKARYASSVANLPALGDDSGLCVNILNGAPGLRSARYASKFKLDFVNNRKLIKNLINSTDKSAYYYCVLVYMRHVNDPRPIVSDGIWHGEILTKAKGQYGFGYDSIFWLPKLAKTVAELSLSEKNMYSHRGQASRTLIEKL